MFNFASDSGNQSDFRSGERESGEMPELYLQLYFPQIVRYGYATGRLREGVTDGKSQKTCLPRSEWPSLRKKSLGDQILLLAQ
jgi:hypothetical protein